MITSLQNSLVKKILKLQQKASERKVTGLFVTEGRREVSLAMAAGIEVVHLLVCEEIYQPDEAYPVHLGKAGGNHIVISRPVYNKIAFRKDVEGVVMVGRQQVHSLDHIHTTTNPLVLVIDRVEKPGNLGAILRTADAAGVEAVILTDPATDVYNPNAIRASLGCVFTLLVLTCQTEDAITWMKHKGIGIYATALQTDTLYFGVDMRGPSALVFGAEDTGLSQVWRDAANQIIKIPMAGRIDSLNVAASVAVLTFEVVRQRHK